VQEVEDKNISKKNGFWWWSGVFCISILFSFGLFLSVFGFISFFNPDNRLSDSLLVKQVSETLVLQGANDAYFATLPTQQIQLIETTSPLRILEVQIALALNFSSDKEMIEAKLPLIQDAIISHLRTVTLEQLQDAGRLFYTKEALLEQMNVLLFPVQIKDVLFQKFVLKEVN